jgi:hypothetical protein
MHWTEILGWVFAVLFFGVGCTRYVEFTNVGFKELTRKLLITAHFIGCFLFSAAMVLVATDQNVHDPDPERKKITYVVFASSLAILFPVHIYLGIKRRIRLIDAQNRAERAEGKLND